MKSFVVVVGLSLIAFTPAFSQTPAPSSPPPAAADQDEPAPAGSKRIECRVSTQSLKGQDRRDQMQLCIAQARLDCLKQAIDKKVVDREQRREFVRNCVGGDDPL
jgi:hypothetical protein